ncbi:unnamed protein product [Candida verbasci]|uniref:Uncharacterized protein n=1 Tax=Candida verbasci TaxID=1227364 RepID=A0A9W4X9B9_9ASCO|nr:unnamed protein product [Candida verbasci]
MISRSIKTTSIKSSIPKITTFKRYNSSHNHDDHHHHQSEAKAIQITFAKIFSIAALLGGFLVYKNKDNTELPILQSQLIDYQLDGTRVKLRDENFNKKYDVGFTRVFALDNGGIGQTIRKNKVDIPMNYNLIPAHSPFGKNFGQGIKLNELGPRRERLRKFAPLESEN